MDIIKLKQVIKQHESYTNFLERAELNTQTFYGVLAGVDPRLSTVQKMIDALREYEPNPEKIFIE